MNNFRPMLSAQCKNIKELQYPLLATPKIDGIRCITRNREIIDPRLGKYQVAGYSRSLKLIPNAFIQNFIALDLNLSGLDGELVVGSNFQESTSGIMSSDGKPDFKYMVFDHFNENDSIEPYFERIQRLVELRKLNIEKKIPRIKLLIPHLIENEQDLSVYEESALMSGCEGVMLRRPESPYKFGRSTWREHYLIKIKRFEDSEAVVVDFVEKYHNANEAQVNALGLTERTTHKENKIPCDTLGALRVMDHSGAQFNIGSGFTDSQRKEIWNNRENYLGKIAKFKHQPYGRKDLPRCPVFIGFRDPRDTDDFRGNGSNTQLSLFT